MSVIMKSLLRYRTKGAGHNVFMHGYHRYQTVLVIYVWGSFEKKNQFLSSFLCFHCHPAVDTLLENRIWNSAHKDELRLISQDQVDLLQPINSKFSVTLFLLIRILPLSDEPAFWKCLFTAIFIDPLSILVQGRELERSGEELIAVLESHLFFLKFTM